LYSRLSYIQFVVGIAYQDKDIVFRFIIEYSSLRDFGPYVIGLFLYEDFFKMIFWLVLKLEISHRVIIEDLLKIIFLHLSFHNSSFALIYFLM
jgi:hypothetical protein